MKTANKSLAGLRDILWDEIEKARENKPGFDIHRTAVVIKGADSIIASYKLELEAHRFFKDRKKPIAGLLEEQSGVDQSGDIPQIPGEAPGKDQTEE